MALGEKIKEYRKINKYSQEKLADLVGVSRQAVTKWESNQSEPSTDNLLKLINIFAISLDDLILDKKISSEKKEKLKGKKWIKIIVILWMTILVALIIMGFIAINLLNNEMMIMTVLWNFINLQLLLTLIALGIYIMYLLVKALNKYIHSK